MAPNQKEVPSFPSGTTSGTRKRPRNEELWARNQAKRLRNLGEEYTSYKTGKKVAARQVGPPCSCRQQCFVRIGEKNINALFKEFWASGSAYEQT